MKKIKNKFIIFIIFLICSILIYIYLNRNIVDRNSYIELIDWTWYLNNIELEIYKREILNKNDNIKTGFGSSMAVINWWDWSITRLWKNTSLKIDENYFSEDWNIIKVAFNIFSGKTWSNVLSYIPEESYFRQSFEDTEVAVRWTIYSLDADKKYIYVESHEVLLKNNNKIIKVWEKKPFSIKTFSFINIKKFLLELKDKAFFVKNKALDNELYTILKKELNEQIINFKKLSSLNVSKVSKKELEKTYNKLLYNYQKLNFISTKDWKDLFDLKIDIKKKLMDVSSPRQKSNLAKSFFYDFKDTIENNKYYAFDDITKVLLENKKYIDFTQFLNFLDSLNLRENINNSIKQNLQNLKKTFSDIKNIWWQIFDTADNFREFTENEIKNTAKEVEKTSKSFFGKVKDFFSWLF